MVARSRPCGVVELAGSREPGADVRCSRWRSSDCRRRWPSPGCARRGRALEQARRRPRRPRRRRRLAARQAAVPAGRRVGRASLALHVIEELFQHLGHCGAGRRRPPAVTVYLWALGPGDPGLLTVRADAVLAGRTWSSTTASRSRRCSTWRRPARSGSASARRSAGDDAAGARSTRLLVELAGRRRHASCASRAATRSSSPAAARRRPRWRRPASPSRSSPGITLGHRRAAYAGIPRDAAAQLPRRSRSSPATRTRRSGADGTVDWEARRPRRRHHRDPHGRRPHRADRRPRSWPAGRPPDTPAAAVRWGTRPEQHTVRATLGTIARAAAGVAVGDRGRRGGRPSTSAGSSGARFRPARRRHPHPPAGLAARRRAAARPAPEPIEVPVIEVVDPADGGAALRAAASASSASYDWVVVTSPNGAERLLAVHPRDARAFGRRRSRRHRSRHGAGPRGRRGPRRPRARAVRGRVAARGPRRPPDAGRVLLAARRSPGDVLPDGLRAPGLGGRRRRRLPHGAGDHQPTSSGPRWPAPTSSPSPLAPRSSASLAAFGAAACRPRSRASAPSPRPPPATAG